MTTTWNPADKGSACVLSNGNLTWASTGSATNSANACRATDYHTAGLGSGNKWYFEVKVIAVHFGNRSPSIALVDALQPLNHRPGDTVGAGGTTLGWALYTRSGTVVTGQTWENGVTTDIGTFYDVNNILMVAVDFTTDPGKLWFGINGTWLGSGNPGAGTGALYSDLTGTLYPLVWGTIGRSAACSVTARFTAAQMTYALPSGFTAWGDSVAAPPPDPVPPDPGDGSDPGTPIDLWRVNPRSAPFSTLPDQFTRTEAGATSKWKNVSPNLFFVATTDDIKQSAPIFDDTSEADNWVSQVAFGPSASVLPTQWFRAANSQRVILVEIDYMTQSGTGATGVAAKSTRYFCKTMDQLGGYFDDTVNHVIYHGRVRSVPRYRRSLDRTTLRGRYSVSIGTLELDNADGGLDAMLADACDGSEVRFYVGDATWTRDQFMLVFKALAVKITASRFDQITVALKDTSLLLNQKIGGTVVIGGDGPSSDKFRPLNFGFVRQIEPVLADPSLLTYVVNETGDNLAISDVRDQGVSVPFTDNADGTITLGSQPLTPLTADIQVDAGYPDVDNGNLTTTLIATRASDAFYYFAGLRAGLLAANLYAGASGNYPLQNADDYHVGISITSATNCVDLLDKICDATNSYWAVRRDGSFTFGWIRPESIDFVIGATFPSIATIVDDNLADQGKDLKIDRAQPTYYSVQGYANKNWTNQSTFAGAVTPDDLELFKRKGLYVPAAAGSDDTATTYLGPESDASGYGVWLGGAPQLYHKTMATLADHETVISCVNDTDGAIELAAWQVVRRAQFLPWLEFVDFVGDLAYFQAELGNVITFNLATRYGLQNVTAQIIDIDIALTENRVALGVVRRRPAITTTYIG